MSTRIELSYQEKDGYLYPQLELHEDDKKPLGRFGRMRKEFLKEERPAHYNYLLLTDQLMTTLHEVDSEAWEMLEQLESELLKKHPYPETQTDFERYKHRQMIRDMAEEIVIHNSFFVV